jgi:hypothetical protein
MNEASRSLMGGPGTREAMRFFKPIANRMRSSTDSRSIRCLSSSFERLMHRLGRGCGLSGAGLRMGDLTGKDRRNRTKALHAKATRSTPPASSPRPVNKLSPPSGGNELVAGSVAHRRIVKNVPRNSLLPALSAVRGRIIPLRINRGDEKWRNDDLAG